MKEYMNGQQTTIQQDGTTLQKEMEQIERLRQQLKSKKYSGQLQQEIEEILQQEAFLKKLELTKDEIDFFGERAAIIEFDGQMPRYLAELMAKKGILERRKHGVAH